MERYNFSELNQKPNEMQNAVMGNFEYQDFAYGFSFPSTISYSQFFVGIFVCCYFVLLGYRRGQMKGPNDKVSLKIYQNEIQQKQNRPGQNRPDATRGGLRTFFVDVIKESPRIENR